METQAFTNDEKPIINRTSSKRSRNRKTLILTLLGLCVVLLSFIVLFAANILNNDRIYSGVTVSGHDVSNYTKPELEEFIKDNLTDKVSQSSLVLKSGDLTKEVKYADLNASIDSEAIIEEAFAVGRTGNPFKRMADIINSKNNALDVGISIDFDRSKLESIIDELSNQSLSSVKQPNLIIKENTVILQSGVSGLSIEKEKAFSEVEKNILELASGNIDLPLVKTNPDPISVDNFYNLINQEPEDPGFKVVNNEVVITPPKVGRKIDKNALSNIVSKLDPDKYSEITLPVSFEMPKKTESQLRASMFKDVLSEYHTWFSTGNTNDSNRGVNIRLAVSKINGKVLGPGDTFSFNDVVGQRTAAAGYQIAHVYVNGKIVDDIGGGICQVSTTLYNSVLLSNLKVTERINHMFTVGYVPYGQDAAVSYGSADLKFKNNTNWPIKIDSWVTSNNNIYFSLKGTKENPNQKVIIEPVTVKTIPFEEVEIEDKTLPVNTTKVKQKGMIGYMVDTYKILKNGNEVVSKEKIHSSYYKPLKQEILKGTNEDIKPTPTPKVIQGVDDASNPPVEIEEIPADSEETEGTI